ncbi:MAG: RDD family protein [Campylobacterales bacterium]
MIYTPILYIITYAIYGGAAEFRESSLAPALALGLFSIIYSFFNTKNFKTPGMKAYELEIVRESDGKRAGFLQVFARFVIFFVSYGLLVGIVFPYLRKDRKGLQDLLTRTYIKEKN